MLGSGSGIRAAYVAESVFGTTPATPSFKTFRVTGGGLRTTKATGTSDERQADRNVRDEFLLGKDVTGTYNFELTYGTFDDFLEGALQGVWASNVLKNGVTPKSYTVEETIELGTTDSFSRFRGVMVNTLGLDIGSREKITSSLGLMGIEEALAEAIVTGATYAAPNANPITTASASVAALTVSGMTTPPRVKRLALSTTNNLRTRPEVGSPYSAEFGSGRFEVTGNLDCYFETNELYQKVLDHGSAALSFTVGNASGSKYTFALPKIIFGDGERAPGGNDDDVMVNIPFRAVYDTTEACTLKITRAVT